MTNGGLTMEVETKSYTLDLLDSMVLGMVSAKESKGFVRLNNGLFEDCIGQIYTVDLIQNKLTNTDGDEILQVSLKMKPVHIAGHL
jgi:hypothetical protein